jgi:hypothetical protein
MIQRPHGRRGGCRLAAVTALCGLAICSGCGTDSPSKRSEAETSQPTTPGERAIKTRYVLTYPDSGGWHALYDVVTAGAQRSRVTFTVPVDDPVTVYRYVWDGDRVLEAGDEADDLSYTLYEAPEEVEGLLDEVTSWILNPESEAFAAACRDAQPFEATKEIAGRNAVGFRCREDDGSATMWIDSETDLLLSLSGIPVGEGGEVGTLRAERVTLDVPVDDRTFSTDPPAGAEVEVVEPTGVSAPPPDQGDGEGSAAELEAELREIAATTTSATPIYYVGPEFDGEALSDVVIFNNDSGGEAEGDHSLDPGQSLGIMYGDEFQMDTAPFRAANYENAAGCRRLPNLRGVPTVQQADAVWLFTAEFVVRLGNTADAPKRATKAARALREASQDHPTATDLPAPPSSIVALVDRACGQKPGDQGPPIEY